MHRSVDITHDGRELPDEARKKAEKGLREWGEEQGLFVWEYNTRPSGNGFTITATYTTRPPITTDDKVING